jgi:2-aminoethylphosphonate transport system permease protein
MAAEVLTIALGNQRRSDRSWRRSIWLLPPLLLLAGLVVYPLILVAGESFTRGTVSYTKIRSHETRAYIVLRNMV